MPQKSCFLNLEAFYFVTITDLLASARKGSFLGEDGEGMGENGKLYLRSIAYSQDFFNLVRLRSFKKTPTPTKWLKSPLPEMVHQICKKYSLENT